MDIQRLRNLTTGRLHTEIGHVYEDIEFLTGDRGVMTHMLPRARRALKAYLREHVPDARFWSDEYDTSHTGDIEVRPMNEAEQAAFWSRYGDLPDPLAGKNVVVIAG